MAERAKTKKTKNIVWIIIVFLLLIIAITAAIVCTKLYAFYRIEHDTLNLSWSNTEDFSIFKSEYLNGDGVVVVSGDKEANVIAPGTSNVYRFRLENSYRVGMDYSMTVDMKNSSSKYDLPIYVQLYIDGGEYLIGNSDAGVPLSEVEAVTHSETLNIGEYTDYVFRWEWPFESGQDEYDTMMARLSSSDPDIPVFNVSMNTTTAPNYDVSGGNIADYNTYRTTMYIPVLILILVIILGLVILLLWMIIKKNFVVVSVAAGEGNETVSHVTKEKSTKVYDRNTERNFATQEERRQKRGRDFVTPETEKRTSIFSSFTVGAIGGGRTKGPKGTYITSSAPGSVNRPTNEKDSEGNAIPAEELQNFDNPSSKNDSVKNVSYGVNNGLNSQGTYSQSVANSTPTVSSEKTYTNGTGNTNNTILGVSVQNLKDEIQKNNASSDNKVNSVNTIDPASITNLSPAQIRELQNRAVTQNDIRTQTNVMPPKADPLGNNVEVIGVILPTVGRTTYYDPDGKTYKVGDAVLVPVGNKYVPAAVTYGNFLMAKNTAPNPLRKVVRLISSSEGKR